MRVSSWAVQVRGTYRRVGYAEKTEDKEHLLLRLNNGVREKDDEERRLESCEKSGRSQTANPTHAW